MDMLLHPLQKAGTAIPKSCHSIHVIIHFISDRYILDRNQIYVIIAEQFEI